MFATVIAALPPQGRRFVEAVGAQRRWLIGLVLGTTVVAVAVSLALPVWYTAEATLLPPSDTSESFGMMSGMIETAALNKLGLFSTQTPSDIVAEILKSRTLREELIRRYDLQQRYHTKNIDLTLMELGHHLKVGVDKSGMISVRLEDRDPARAAEMTNALVGMLDRFNRETLNTRAKRTRQFLQERLDEVTRHMGVAESAMAVYERKNKVIASTESGTVGTVAGLMAERMNLQVRRAYLSSFTRADSPTLQEIDSQMRAYEEELAKLPGLKQEGSRLALDAEIQRRVFTLLTAQYENARVEELRDTPTLTVLDAARAPLIKTRPRRSVIVLAAAALSAAMGLGWVAFSIRRQPVS